MKFTDIFIKRPVLASVISLLILLFGARALHTLPLRQFPKMENTVITVTTAYAGANASLVQGFLTTPLQKAIASADGIDYMTSTSTDSMSTIQAFVKLNFDPDKAFTNIMSKVAQVRGELPRESEAPIIKKDTGDQIALMYISFNSAQMSPQQITDYISRVVQPKLETISGVASAEILGDNTFAMRIWINPQRMASLNITNDDLIAALRSNNFQSTAGTTKGEYVAKSINAHTDLHTVEGFQNLVIKNAGTAIRLKDIARVELGTVNYDSSVIFNGNKSIFIGINASPKANPLTVIEDVRKEMPTIEANFPPSLSAKIVYDATEFIRASLHEVLTTIFEATFIVVAVIFLFLGSVRSVLIPVVTIPLSLIGVASLMLALGYSLNLLTLLAMVLAIGLVVDDAIVVVENIHRHIEHGMTRYEAALVGAREIALPVITMTITLAAVYAPIGLMQGLTGALFREFAFTLACAVIISGVIALTLSPMMCSRVLTSEISSGGLVKKIDQTFDRLQEAYRQRLHTTLLNRNTMLVLAAAVFASCFFLYSYSAKQLAPDEDQSVLFISSSAPESANSDYVSRFSQEFNAIFKSIPENQDYFIINGMGAVNQIIAGLILKPWDQRKRSQGEILPLLQNKMNDIAGLFTMVFPLPSLPVGGDDLPIGFVLTTTDDYRVLQEASQDLLDRARKSGLFMFVDSSLKFNKPELSIKIDRNKASQLGISMESIGNALAVALGGNYVNRFSMEGRSYRVIPQVERQYRLNSDEIKSIHVKTYKGDMVPLSTIATITGTIQPNMLSQFQQLNSATIFGMPVPGVTIADALGFLQKTAHANLPESITYDYQGQSRQFMEESDALMLTFVFALLVIYLVLAAQFESFRDPWIIMISVPMSLCGALLMINLLGGFPFNKTFATINIYSQVGLITLIGLISKHGILMVDFANHLRREKGVSAYEAIEQAAAIRLRPILMTTAAMVLGVLPLLIASGAGAQSRKSIGLVIFSGMLIGTIFTLFVVPTMYTFLSKERAVAQG